MKTLVLHPIRMAATDDDEDDDLLVGDSDFDQPGEESPSEEDRDNQGPGVGGGYHEDDGGEPEQF